MLQFIREKAQGWILGGIIALICIPFAFFGINSYVGGGGGAVVVAEVNGTKLDLQRFQTKYQDFRRRFLAQFGQQIDPDDINDEQLKSSALELMVDEEILRQASAEAGLRISERQIAGAINAFEAFRDDDEFEQNRYELFLRNNGLTPAGFEAQVHDDMLGEQFRQGIAESVFVSDAEVQSLIRLAGQKRDFSYLIFSAAPHRDTVVVTDAQMQQHYDDNVELFMTAEKVKVQYVELSLKKLMEAVVVSEAELAAYYDEHKANYSVVEQRSANHILVELSSEAEEMAVEEAREEAQGYRQRALAGEAFEDIAREVSDDVGSRADGGETGLFRKGSMAPKFDEMVFSMSVGEVSEPVRTEFGFHIIKLREVKPAGIPTFAEARMRVDSDFRTESATEIYRDNADLLIELSHEHDETLEVVSADLELTIQYSDWVSRDAGTGIFAEPKVMNAAFDSRVLLEGLNSRPIEVGNEVADSRLFVLRREEHEDAANKPLAEVKAEIREVLIQETAKTLAAEAGQTALQRMAAGESAAALGESLGLEWQPASDVDRRDSDVNPGVLATAFKLSHPAEGKVVRAGVPLASGDYGVIELSEVRYADPGEASEAELAQSGTQLRTLKGRAAWGEFVSGLEQAAEVVKFEGNL